MLCFSEPRLLRVLSLYKLGEIQQQIETMRDSREEHLVTIMNPMRLAAKSEHRQYFKKILKRMDDFLNSWTWLEAFKTL